MYDGGLARKHQAGAIKVCHQRDRPTPLAFRKPEGWCLPLGLHYHTRAWPDRHTATPPPVLMAVLDQFSMGSGAPRCGPLFVLLGSVDSDGMGKQNSGEAMWLLHSHGALAYWIRLMSVQGGVGVLLHCSLL